MLSDAFYALTLSYMIIFLVSLYFLFHAFILVLVANLARKILWFKQTSSDFDFLAVLNVV